MFSPQSEDITPHPEEVKRIRTLGERERKNVFLISPSPKGFWSCFLPYGAYKSLAIKHARTVNDGSEYVSYPPFGMRAKHDKIVVYDDYGITSDMWDTIEEIKDKNIPVYRRQLPNEYADKKIDLTRRTTLVPLGIALLGLAAFGFRKPLISKFCKKVVEIGSRT